MAAQLTGLARYMLLSLELKRWYLLSHSDSHCLLSCPTNLHQQQQQQQQQWRVLPSRLILVALLLDLYCTTNDPHTVIIVFSIQPSVFTVDGDGLLAHIGYTK
jgi:hypothetical protein